MPFLRIETNVPKEQIPGTFLETTTDLLAKILGKPKNYCAVLVLPNQLMTFGGTSEPCGYASLMSIGKLGVEENKTIAKAIYKDVEKHLGIPKDRMYISFIDSKPSEVGYNGSTFHDIFGGN